MDYGNYEGLVDISSLADWLSFVRDSVIRREALIARQQEFLDRLAIPLDPNEVGRRFLRLFSAQRSGPVLVTPSPRLISSGAFRQKKVLFIASDRDPTLQISFLNPLAHLVASGVIKTDIVTERDLDKRFPLEAHGDGAGEWMANRIRESEPDLIVCCRYTGPQEATITRVADEIDVPVVFHIDDDLLNVPADVGSVKQRSASRQECLRTVDHLLKQADLVYCSTFGLKKRLRHLGYGSEMVAGVIYSAGRIINPAEFRSVTTIGYMGLNFAHDLDVAVPALVEVLKKYPDIRFELFSSVPLPPALRRFGEQVSVLPPVMDYKRFMQALADRHWDIGLCPLVSSSNDGLRSNTKWVEYSLVGAATIATRSGIYDGCCADDCGLLVEPDGWYDSIVSLIEDPRKRFDMVERAQLRVATDYSVERLSKQVLSIFDRALAIRAGRVENEDWGVSGGRRAWQTFNGSYLTPNSEPIRGEAKP